MNENNVTDSRIYEYMSNGDLKTITVNYDLLLAQDGKLLKVYNEAHHSVEEDSECFQHFKTKYYDKKNQKLPAGEKKASRN